MRTVNTRTYISEHILYRGCYSIETPIQPAIKANSALCRDNATAFRRVLFLLRLTIYDIYRKGVHTPWYARYVMRTIYTHSLKRIKRFTFTHNSYTVVVNNNNNNIHLSWYMCINRVY